MYNHVLYLFYWAISSMILFITSSVSPTNVVLGNFRFNKTEAAIYAGFWVTFILWTVMDLLTARGFKLSNIILYLVVFIIANSMGFWMVARFAQLFGYGIVNYQWALLLGVVVSVVQAFSSRVTFVTEQEGKKRR